MKGLPWDVAVEGNRTAFTAEVATPQGKATYAFRYEAKGASLSVNDAGNIVADDGMSITRAVMVRNDGRSEGCSGWTRMGDALAFTCDDTTFPETAYPYHIDPTVSTTTVSNLRSCEQGYQWHSWGGGTSYGPICTSNSWALCFQNDSEYNRTCTTDWSVDTSSIPTNATITNLTLKWWGLRTANISWLYYGKYGTELNGHSVGAPTGGGPFPWQTVNVTLDATSAAPFLVKGGLTPFHGLFGCPYVGEEIPYVWAQLSNFTMSVTYGVPSPTTITTSVPGLAVTVDGVS